MEDEELWDAVYRLGGPSWGEVTKEKEKIHPSTLATLVKYGRQVMTAWDSLGLREEAGYDDVYFEERVS